MPPEYGYYAGGGGGASWAASAGPYRTSAGYAPTYYGAGAFHAAGGYGWRAPDTSGGGHDGTVHGWSYGAADGGGWDPVAYYNAFNFTNNYRGQ